VLKLFFKKIIYIILIYFQVKYTLQNKNTIILIYFQVKYILQNNNTDFLLLYLYFLRKQLVTSSWKLKHISDLWLASSSSVFSLKKRAHLARNDNHLMHPSTLIIQGLGKMAKKKKKMLLQKTRNHLTSSDVDMSTSSSFL
jgi:hypothetical protein